jgi:hypothetical protein
LAFSFGVMLLAAASSLAQSGQAESRQATVRARPMQVSLGKTPPELPPQRAPKVIEHPRIETPVDPSVRPEDIRPTNPETVVKILPEALLETPAPEQAAPQAPGTFTFFRNTALNGAPVVGGQTLNAYIPIEPSGAANGRVIFYTTNSYAAFSGDGGQTFTYLNPFDIFPQDGTNDAINGGFGGDQVVYYERTRGLMFWLLQYFPDNTTNMQRLVVFRSQADVLNLNWPSIAIYDFTPATYGFTTPPAGASGFWLDFPDLAVSDNFLYLTTNVFQRTPTCPAPAGTTSTCTFAGAVIARIPLNQLALAAGQINFNFYTDAHSSYRCTHGAHETMYWGSHNSTTQIRIYRWAENSGNIAWDDVNHTAYNTGTMTATSPDGSNFAARADDKILGAWVANGVIGFMWNAAQGGGFAFPHVQVLRFNESDRRLLSQGQIFNNNNAFLYPSVHPNDSGDIGGTMASGGGIFYPAALAWIADDFNGGTITPLEHLAFALGTAGPCDPAFAPPAGGCYNRWGDYFSTRVSVPYGNTWVGTGFVVNGAGGVTRDPRYVWFGRERDTPPPTNTIFVSLGNTSGWEDGSFAHPYNTVTEGHFAAMPGDTILIAPGNYPETLTFRTPVKVDILKLGGTVTIGKR